jgi:endoglucanase
MALRESEMPEGCTRTIYMCDDGKDPLKRDWVESLPDDVIYVSGPRNVPQDSMCSCGHL